MREILKYVSATLLAIVISLVGTWMMISPGLVTTSNIDNISPYTKDRKLIIKTMKDNSNKLEEQTKAINNLTNQIGILADRMKNEQK